MRYQEDSRLSLITSDELGALAAPQTLADAATLENTSLGLLLYRENAATWHIGPTVRALAVSPLWRLMCEELLATPDAESFRVLFLTTSARLMLAGATHEEVCQ